MHSIKNLYTKNVKYDLINKFYYKNIKKLPELKKIVFNFGCKSTHIKKLAASLLALELITEKKGSIRRSKKPNLTLRVKKGNPTGCIVTLNKNHLKINFIYKMLFEILTQIKLKHSNEFSLKSMRNGVSFACTIKNPSNYFRCLKDHYNLFNDLSHLNVIIITDSLKKKEALFFFKQF